MKIKIGIIGCGNIANSAHIPAYLKNPAAEIRYFAIFCPSGLNRLWRNMDAAKR